MNWSKSILGFLELPWYRRQKALAKERPAISRDEFVARVSTTDLGRHSAGLLWEKLEEAKVVENFHPYPLDDLLHTFGLAEEDLDEDIILAIIKAVGSIIPSRKLLKEFGPIETPLDIVKLIEMANRGNWHHVRSEDQRLSRCASKLSITLRR